MITFSLDRPSSGSRQVSCACHRNVKLRIDTDSVALSVSSLGICAGNRDTHSIRPAAGLFKLKNVSALGVKLWGRGHSETHPLELELKQQSKLQGSYPSPLRNMTGSTTIQNTSKGWSHYESAG